MSELQLRLLLKAEAAQASAALRQAATEVQGLGAAAKTAAADGQAAATGTKALGAAAAQTDAQVAGLKSELAALKAQLDGVTASETAAGANAVEMAAKIRALEAALGRGGRSGGTGASGAAGNLVAQFNDIGVMMAAGQNPLQLAIQQGTQITQVIGPMGAGGAVKALGGAFLGMLSPINLIVIGSIAAGAAMIQWLTGANADARTFDDALSDVETSINSLNESANAFSTDGLQSIKDKYGAITAEVLRLLDAQRQLDQRDARTNLSDTLGGLSNTLSDGLITTGEATIRTLFQTDIEQSRQLKDEILQIGSLGSFQQQAAALAGFQDRLLAVNGGISTMSEKQYEFYQQLVASEAAVRQLAATEQSFVGPATAALRELIEAERTLRTEQVERAVEAAAARQEDAAWAQGQLESLAQQSNLMALIGQYGAESAEVSAFRATAERDVFVAMLETRDLTEAQKNELMVSYDVMVLMSNTNLAGPIAAAVGSAAALAEQLGISLGLAQSLARVGVADPRTGNVVFDPRDPAFNAEAAAAARTAVLMEQLAAGAGSVSPFDPSRQQNRAPRNLDSGAGRSPGGGGSTAQARDGLAGLQAEAAAALAGLDLAVAGIAEKVRAGLMSSAEGADAVDSATRRAAEGIATLIPKIERIGPAGIAVASDLRGSMMGLVADLRAAGSDLSASLSGSFKGAFAAFLSGAKSGQDAFAAFGDFIKDKIAEILAERFTSQFVTPLFDSILGAVGLGAAPAVPDLGAGPAVPGTGVKAGSAAGLTYLSSYSNDIMQGPGIALSKGRSQRQSATADGGTEPGSFVTPGRAAAGDVIVNVTTAPGTAPKVSQRNEGGTRIIDVMIEQVAGRIAGDISQGRGPVPDALGASYGLKRVPR